MNGSESSGSRSLLADLGLSGLLSDHSSLSEEDDVSVRELLLELSGEPERLVGNGLERGGWQVGKRMVERKMGESYIDRMRN